MSDDRDSRRSDAPRDRSRSRDRGSSGGGGGGNDEADCKLFVGNLSFEV
jgi:hypothetical protein